MLRYENFSNIGIETSLHNGYSIVGFALWDKALGQYTANFYIKDDQVNHLDLMEDHSSIVIKSDIQNIRNDLNKYITRILRLVNLIIILKGLSMSWTALIMAMIC